VGSDAQSHVVPSLFSTSSRPSPNTVHIACEHDNESLVRMFLCAGAVVDELDKNGCTPLFTSVRAGGSPAVLKLLLGRGAEVDAAPEGEPTSLALASGMGCLTTVQLLVRILPT